MIFFIAVIYLLGAFTTLGVLFIINRDSQVITQSDIPKGNPINWPNGFYELEHQFVLVTTDGNIKTISITDKKDN
jgi:hypothetical protein